MQLHNYDLHESFDKDTCLQIAHETGQQCDQMLE